MVSSIKVNLYRSLIKKTYIGFQCRYIPLFDYFKDFSDSAFRVVADDYVTSDSGTGIVHCAPAFGEDDNRVCIENGIIKKVRKLMKLQCVLAIILFACNTNMFRCLYMRTCSRTYMLSCWLLAV